MQLPRRIKLFLSFLFFILYLQIFSQDTIVVQIAHGSKPRKQYNNEFRTIGGKKGGHVVIQVDNFVYGFYFTGYRIHVFPHHKRKNGTFQEQTLNEWTNATKDKKVTKIFIPVTKDEKQTVLTFYKDNIIKPTYDYSFFGQRCASSTYNLLKTIHKIKGGGRFCNAFYPGQLRKKIVRQSKKLGYPMIVKPGTKTRIWEGD